MVTRTQYNDPDSHCTALHGRHICHALDALLALLATLNVTYGIIIACRLSLTLRHDVMIIFSTRKWLTVLHNLTANLLHLAE